MHLLTTEHVAFPLIFVSVSPPHQKSRAAEMGLSKETLIWRRKLETYVLTCSDRLVFLPGLLDKYWMHHFYLVPFKWLNTSERCSFRGVVSMR